MKTRGFTLIELMITVAIVGILAAIATGKFADLLTKSKEGRAKSFLGTLRSTIAVYYGDNSYYPGELVEALTTEGRYITAIPRFEIPEATAKGNPGHAIDNAVATAIDDAATGNWAYFIGPDEEGKVFVNCSHNDSRNALWTSQ